MSDVKYILGSRKVYDRMEEMLMSDHERIWLQHPDDADQYQGRLWCEDKVWPDEPEEGEPTEYVRADLHAAALAEIERLRGILAETVPDPEYRRMQDREIERLREQVKRKP